MLRGVTLLAGAALLSGGAFSVPSDAMSVEEVIANIEAFDGKDVTVHGWLGRCSGYDCGLFVSVEDAEMVENGETGSDEWLAAFDRSLRIGGGSAFDALASTMQFREVVIEGRASSECFQPNTFCFDRASDIEPSSIRRVL
ncbi:hypothetical protein VM77_09220 [Citromicrobium sp. JL31]|nr:hypothetical protein [Citromicrobium sp. JL477]ALG60134.1 hypothetical protein WG74_04155 [Citromicrobium sp. JL477]KPM17486.1 hypothetical protein VM77_09220 [Citromicrobium sp. JL31]KPM18802.1 hypothetical protein VO58_01525 [Citromicrobium sp. JL1351]KPM29790.1 hypothetical protein VO57_01525 [Citromicrobium sp. JL2201]